MFLDHTNYFSKEADMEYMSVSQFKLFNECEAKALATIKGQEDAISKDSFLEGQLFEELVAGDAKLFMAQHPELISTRGATSGQLKSAYSKVLIAAEKFNSQQFFRNIIEKCEKQTILTGEICDIKVKCKLDLFDKKTNSITLSGRHQDAVINIDFETGDLNWIIGDPNGWNAEYLKYFFTGGDGFEWQYAQHAAEILPNGNVFIFDNGNNRSKIKEEYVDADHNYSRAVIYKINTDNMTVEQVWEYGKELGAKFYSPYISDVDYLSNNHYLILSGGNASKGGKYLNVPAGLDNADTLRSTLVEIQNNKVIFELILPTNDYRAEKINIYDVDSYYLNNASRLGNMGETKTDKSINPLFNKGIDETYKSKNIKITKEADRLVFTGTFQKDDKVSLILNGVFSNKTYNVRISNRPYTAMCVDIFNESNKEGITVNKYINDVGMKGKYYIYVKINDTIYDPDLFVLY